MLSNVNEGFDFVKIQKPESKFKFYLVYITLMSGKKESGIVKLGGKTIDFLTKALNLSDTISFELKNKKLKKAYPKAVNSLRIISNGTNHNHIATIAFISQLNWQNDEARLKNSRGHSFNKKINYIFFIDKKVKPALSLPKDDGTKFIIIEEIKVRLKNK